MQLSKSIPARLLLLPILLALPTPTLASPPKVLHASPDRADTGIDPAVTHLTVVFDQDMDVHGQSICGSGPTYPGAGTPTWTDARTLVLPIKLEPGRTYALSINCPAAVNSRSVHGEPAEVYPITFATRAAGDPAPALTEDQARAAAATLREAIDRRYSYASLRGVDWPAAFARHAPALEAARTPSAFARGAARLLAEGKDPHVTVRVGEFTLGTVPPLTKTNFDLGLVKRLVKDLEQKSPRVWTGHYADVPYALIADWTGPAADYEPFFAFIDKERDAPGLILDVRPNSGGDERTARTVAGVFATRTAVYSRHKVKDPAAPTGWQPQGERSVGPAEGRTHFDGRVAVLMGPACMSSNESFLLMMRHATRALLVGERSRGSSGRPQPVDLGIGVTVNLPTWVDMTPAGDFIEGVGIEPDIEAPSLTGTDPALGEGLRQVSHK
jgi:RNA polymerase sigma-70 factor (ECF subfamily)